MQRRERDEQGMGISLEIPNAKSEGGRFIGPVIKRNPTVTQGTWHRKK